MTYRELFQQLSTLNNEQLDYEVTVEMEYEDVLYPAELRITGVGHTQLNEDVPVIFVKEY